MKDVRAIIFTQDVNEITYVQKEPPENPTEGAIWIDTSTYPPTTKRYNGESWEPIDHLASNVVTSLNEPTNPREGLVWVKPDTGEIYVYYQDQWKKLSSSQSVEQVKYVGDNRTIVVDKHNVISVKFNNEESTQPGYVWDNKRIQKEALVKALIFG